MITNNLFDDLFVLEMANNHQGSVEHGLKIIDEAAALVKKYKLNAGVKLQYRQLDTFIHPDAVGKKDVKHIPRFLDTRLSNAQFKKLIDRIKEHKMVAIVTPFDEASVDVCIDHDVDIIKIASCSAGDWPLLEKAAAVNRPILASTGGLRFNEIDNLVSFLEHRKIDFALMHCVSIYPTPNDQAQIDFMRSMKKRYPGVTIGYSGHESPTNLDIAKVAVGAGAQMLERHIGVETDTIKLNGYSMNPKELDKWMQAALEAKKIMGSGDEKIELKVEQDSLLSLARGVYAKKPIKNGQEIGIDDVYFAMPCLEGQLDSGHFGQYRATVKGSKDYKKNEPIFEQSKGDLMHQVRGILHECKSMINMAGIRLGKKYNIEISHHYGLDNFRETGCTIVNLINREYCKKLIIVLPGQKHPSHRHVIKEETFQLLWGDLFVRLDDTEHHMEEGDMMLVERGRWHTFESDGGAIFEEISTTHKIGDSYYKDESIAKLDPMQRKTVIDQW